MNDQPKYTAAQLAAAPTIECQLCKAQPGEYCRRVFSPAIDDTEPLVHGRRQLRQLRQRAKECEAIQRASMILPMAWMTGSPRRALMREGFEEALGVLREVGGERADIASPLGRAYWVVLEQVRGTDPRGGSPTAQGKMAAGKLADIAIDEGRAVNEVMCERIERAL